MPGVSKLRARCLGLIVGVNFRFEGRNLGSVLALGSRVNVRC